LSGVNRFEFLVPKNVKSFNDSKLIVRDCFKPEAMDHGSLVLDPATDARDEKVDSPVTVEADPLWQRRFEFKPIRK